MKPLHAPICAADACLGMVELFPLPDHLELRIPVKAKTPDELAAVSAALVVLLVASRGDPRPIVYGPPVALLPRSAPSGSWAAIDGGRVEFGAPGGCK